MNEAQKPIAKNASAGVMKSAALVTDAKQTGQRGDWVLAGETIATVGDSGGQNDTALYFEIRKGAKPLNPSHSG